MFTRESAISTAPSTRRRSISEVVERLGLAMRRHRQAIIAIQWIVVAFYVTLLVAPAMVELPPEEAGILDSLVRFSQFVFWGIWWPFVILSTMFLGRIWCGVLCPEGALTEWASQFGRGRGIPRWVKWGGWPFVAFTTTTVYGQLVSVYEYPKPALLVLGGSTVAAVIIALLFGRNKRVWCRYLCPVSGVFGLLAKVAPLHYAVDRRAWETAPPGKRTSRGRAVNCAPLVDIRRMQSASPCHMCGRCAGERNAVQLALRSPNAELLNTAHQPSRWEVVLLITGMLGIALGAFQWSASPWLVDVKQQLGTWLVDKELFWPLDTNAPWWVLTHYPSKNEVFNWLDGVLIIGYIFGTALLVSVWSACWLRVGSILSKIAPWRLAYAMLPFAGLSVFLGLSALTVTLLRSQGYALTWISDARAVVLVIGVLWSGRIGWGMQDGSVAKKCAAAGSVIMALSVVIWLWVEMFFIW